jgi:hypothetical protein
MRAADDALDTRSIPKSGEVGEDTLPADERRSGMSSDEESRKRAIFESMSPKRQRRILEKGYENWNPFLPPKEPPFFSEAERQKHRQAAELLSRFINHATDIILKTHPSPLYLEAVRDMAFGLARGDERYQAMYDYGRWLVLSGERNPGKEG